jgi:hypothetical protein
MKARVKRLEISPEAFLYIMCSETAWRVSKGLPKGSKMRGFTMDPYTQKMILFVEHESFPEVDINKSVAPIIETEFKRIV